jgi:hypothetical protein
MLLPSDKFGWEASSMKSLLLPFVLGTTLIAGCSVAVSAKTQTRYTSDIPSKSSTMDWAGQPIAIDDAALDVLVNGGLNVTGDPTATKITVTGRAVAYADSTDEASANLTIADVLATIVITEAADSIHIACGHGQAHGTSSVGHSGCELLNITVPGGSTAKPAAITAKAGSGDVTVTGITGSVTANSNGSGDVSATVTPTKGSVISLSGSFGVKATLPADFAADSITLTSDTPADLDTTAFPDVMSGKGRGTAGTGASSITLTSTGPGKVVLASQ